jgi:thiamine pyrophosphokinase
MPHKAIVLSNGAIDNPNLMRLRLIGWEDALVIGADAGTLHAGSLGLELDLVIGDFDSLGRDMPATLQAQGVEVIVHPAAKNETDLELALIAAVERGADQIAVLGATGGRLDMTLASVLLLTHLALVSTHTEIWVDNQTAWLMRPPGGKIQGHEGDTISLIPIGGDSLGVKTENLVYPLKEETLVFGPARGVSNVLAANTARVNFSTGLLFVIHTPGRA